MTSAHAIRGGLVFDGLGSEPRRADVLVEDGREDRSFMSVARAVQRLTSEIAEWMGIEAGTLREGDRADVVVVDPAGLTDAVDRIEQAPMPGMDLLRPVRRNDDAVRAVLIRGRLAYTPDHFADDFGHATRYGSVLRARG